jgi:SagB-type dehydrogenase family enzyme
VAESIEEVISRRGSARRFRRDPIGSEALSVILDLGSRPVETDCGWGWNDLYVIVHAVEGLRAGAYYYDGKLHPLKAGDFRREAAHLALEQDLAGDAAAAVFFLSDWERLGDRGYRVAQLEAGIRGGKMYLAAYALGLGATGLTFYDDDVVRFFSPHAAGKSAIFLMVFGHPARRTA